MASQFEFFDGFGLGNLDLWDEVNNGASLVTGISGMDTYSVSCNGNYLNVVKYVTARDEYYVSCLVRPVGTIDRVFMWFFNGSTVLGTLRSGGNVSAYRSNNTLIATGSIPFLDNTTYLLEVYYKPHVSNGSFIVKINNVIDPNLNLTGIQTSPSTLQINKIIFGHWDISSAPYFGRVIIAVDSWIGDLRIQTLMPTAAGNYSEWSPSTGSNYQTVDEIPYSDTDYNLTNEVDKKDSFVCADLSGSIALVKSVIVQNRVWSEGAATPTKLNSLIRLSGTDYLGTSNGISTTGKTLYHKWDQNPSNSSNWTVNDINNAEIGYNSAT